MITQLRVLGIGKGAELGAAVAIEHDGNVYAPLHDHRGNICSLADARSGETVATYRYSAFGELAESYGITCPWTFASKRLDDETASSILVSATTLRTLVVGSRPIHSALPMAPTSTPMCIIGQ